VIIGSWYRPVVAGLFAPRLEAESATARMTARIGGEISNIGHKSLKPKAMAMAMAVVGSR
jgi:hypothetical protein